MTKPTKAIINKHIDNSTQLTNDKFVSELEKAKGEIIICNDPENPTIYIMDTQGNPRKISGGGGGGTTSSYDDTAIWAQVNTNTAAIEELQKGGVGGSSTLETDIIVAGLDSKFGAGNYKNGDVISAGTPYQTIIENFLCKESYPTNVNTQSAVATASMNDLTLKLDQSDVVEVGTLITMTEAKTNGSEANTTASTVSNMTNGYSWSDNDTRISTNTSIVKPCTATVLDNNYTISATITSGFNADTVNNVLTTPETQTGVDNASLLVTALGCVKEGENSVTINATGASYSYSADAIEKVYYCSNLGKTDSTKFVNGVAAVSATTDKAATSKTATVTGAYKYFMGYSSNTSFEQFDSEAVRGLDIITDWLVTDGTTELVSNGTIVKSNGMSVVIACPASYKLASINYSNQADMLPKFSANGIVSVMTGEIATDYMVYVYPITNNAVVEFTNVTLVKA